MKRLLPVAIAIVILAALGGGLWWANRAEPIPSAPSKAMPAVGTCWNVTSVALTATLPWPGSAVACNTSHTAEVMFTGQVDRSLIKTFRSAKGQNAKAASVLMQAEARTGCTGHANAYLGAPWRGSQLTIVPDFVSPETDGFYVCAVAQVADPGGTSVVSRTAPLAGALTGDGAKKLAIDCYAQSGDALSFVPCTAVHKGEYVGLYTVTPLGAQFNGPELQGVVTKGCQSLLNAFLGLPDGAADRTDLRSSYVGPTTSATWLGSDQSFACYASAETAFTGSVKGLGTRSLPR